MNKNVKTVTKNNKAPSSTEYTALLRVLQFDVDLRRIDTEKELIYYLANETRPILGYRQAFVFQKKNSWSLSAVSSVTSFDKNAPINRQIKQFVADLNRKSNGMSVRRVRISENIRLDALTNYTFPNAIWAPFKTKNGKIFAGLLILHEKEWPESVIPLVERIAEASSYTWRYLKGPRLEKRKFVPKKFIFTVLFLVLISTGFMQAPLTVLAPVEVSSGDSITVTIPLDGVIESVDVTPNQLVSAGDVVVRMDSTELRNTLAIADQRVVVAQARLRQLQNTAFTDRAASRQLKVAEAEVNLATAERNLAQDRLDRTEIKTNKSGIAVFDDSQSLTGRPVTIGEKIMEIVSPDNLEFTVRLPVIDNVSLEKGSKVRVFLDGDPLNPITAALVDTSYRAVTQPDGSFSYTLKAYAEDQELLENVRIGAYGTAQLYGGEHSLYYIIFRRPLSWLRQNIGI